MKIETKFSIKDKICIIDYCGEWVVQWVNVRITGIDISVGKKYKLLHIK